MKTTEKNIMRETIKKSSLKAKTIYDYKKLCFPGEHLISMDMQEEKEELIISYHTAHLTPFTEIRSEDNIIKLAVLMNARKLYEAAREYEFDMSPENLFYDINGQVMVKARDIYDRGKHRDKKRFLDEYKALIGHSWQKQYSYKDYLEGGKLLLSKNKLLKEIRELEEPEAVLEILENYSTRLRQEMKSKKITVFRSRYQGVKAALILSLIALIAAAAYAGYTTIYVLPYQQAVMKADNAYIESDYVAIIDALSTVDLERMSKHQKYILAVAYIRSENLTPEQKDNILSEFSVQENEKVMEYWISLGRMDVLQAKNIAMQQSDDELLLYAYMKEKSMIETDASVSGEEKSKQLSDIESKMKPLMEKYDSEEQ